MVNLPPVVVRGIGLLGSLGGETFAKLLEALDEDKGSFNRGDLARVVKMSTSLTSQNSNIVAAALLALHDPEKWYGRADALDRVTHAVLGDLPANAAKPSPQNLRERLGDIRALRRLAAYRKSINVLTDNERNYTGARVLSDVRPVFGDDTALSPDAAVVVHFLRIDYEENEANRSTFFALDDNDLDLLITTLNRAKAKSASIKPLLRQLRIPYLESENR